MRRMRGSGCWRPCGWRWVAVPPGRRNLWRWDRDQRVDGVRAADAGEAGGIFERNGLDVTIKKIPQKDRHLAIASGDIECAATTVETWIVWNANGVPTRQISSSTSPTVRTAWSSATRSARSRSSRARPWRPRPRDRTLLHACLVPLQERPLGEGRHGLEPGPGGGPGLHRRAERCRRGEGGLAQFQGDDRAAARAGLRDHGCRREADGRAVRRVRQVPPLAGPAANKTFFAGEIPELQQGGGPAARIRGSSARCRQSRASSTRGSSTDLGPIVPQSSHAPAA